MEMCTRENTYASTRTARTVVHCGKLSQDDYFRLLSTTSKDSSRLSRLHGEEQPNSSSDEEQETTSTTMSSLTTKTTMKRTLSELERIQVIRRGDVGRVIVVRDVQHPSNVFTLKEMSKTKVEKENMTMSVVNEQKILNKCSHHPNIVKLHQTLQNDSCVYLLLDYLIGT